MRPLQERGEEDGGGHSRASLAADVQRVPRPDREERSVSKRGPVQSGALPRLRSDLLKCIHYLIWNFFV